MSSYWYNKVSSDPDNLANYVDSVEFFEQQISEAMDQISISSFNELAKEAAELPGIIAYRYNQLQELEALLELLHIKLKMVKGKVFKRYLEAYNRQLSSRDADRYAEADKEVCDLDRLINHIALVRNQFLGVLKGLDTKNWQITNATKLKTSGFEDFRIGS
jgi:hypothetical protein